MKHRHKDIDGSRREFVVEIPSEEVREELDRLFGQIKETAHVPGFRKGKVPRDILEKYHGKAVRERVLSDLVSDSYRRAARESNTIPIGLPRISDVEFREGKDFSYKATVDIRPKIDLKKYKYIKVKKKRIEVKDEDVEEYLSRLQESFAQFESIEGRTARLGDYLVCDVSCEVEGKSIYKEKKNIFLFLNKEYSMPELVDGLIGASKGEKKEIKATLPKNTEEPKYSEKEALFKIKVNQIKEKHLPDINDEFVKGLGTYQNVAQLKETARKDIARRKEEEIRQDMSGQILEELLRSCRFSAPQGLVEEERERLVKGIKGKVSDELRENLQKEAAKRVRLFFILDEIAKRENIDVNESEVDETLSLLAQQSSTSKEAVKKYYQDNNLLSHLKSQLRENKIIEFLVNNAEVKEGG